MEHLIEQTLSKQTLQFGLRYQDYIALVLVATVGSFFVSRLVLTIVLLVMAGVFRYINRNKRRFFWSSVYIWLITNTNLTIRQTKKLPPLLKD